jgi:hypothetical protein
VTSATPYIERDAPLPTPDQLPKPVDGVGVDAVDDNKVGQSLVGRDDSVTVEVDEEDSVLNGHTDEC